MWSLTSYHRQSWEIEDSVVDLPQKTGSQTQRGHRQLLCNHSSWSADSQSKGIIYDNLNDCWGWFTWWSDNKNFLTFASRTPNLYGTPSKICLLKTDTTTCFLKLASQSPKRTAQRLWKRCPQGSLRYNAGSSNRCFPKWLYGRLQLEIWQNTTHGLPYAPSKDFALHIVTQTNCARRLGHKKQGPHPSQTEHRYPHRHQFNFCCKSLE